MKAVALVAPGLVLALVHLLQRLEAWALEERLPERRPLRAAGPLGAEATRTALRQAEVTGRGPARGASNRG